MAKLLRLRRGTDTQHTTFTGAEGEVTVNTTNDSLHVHDGATAGGTELAKADLSNAAGASIPGTLTVNQLVVDDDGSGSPTLRVSGDDGAPWGLVVNNNTYTSSDILGFRVNQGNDGTFYMDYQGDGSYETILIRSGDGTTSQNIISIDSNRAVNLHHANSTKLTTTSTGINVTGSVTCDGLTSDGTVQIRTGSGGLIIKETVNTGSNADAFIKGRDSANGELWYFGTDTTPDLYIWNYQNGEIEFATNDTPRAKLTSDGHFVPNSDDSYDLGSTALQWRNGYFDGAVYTDQIVCDGPALIAAATGELFLRDNDDSGNNTSVYSTSVLRGQDSAGTNKWWIGDTSSSTTYLEVWNAQNGPVVFGTNNADRCYVSGDGHFVPWSNNTYDLGTSSLRWRNVYTNDLNLSNEGSANDVDGTWGNWTIQEGEDDLFLLNRRNGKKYKFNLSEVN